VRAVAEKLKAAGYRSTVGRPKRGEKALKPALSVIFGKSLRTVERYLEEKDEEEIPSTGGISQNPYLLKALRSLQGWEKTCQNPTEAEAVLLKKLPAFVKAIEKAVSPLE
jgi:ParB family transcriptional regulator, chromosome partitioning protein